MKMLSLTAIEDGNPVCLIVDKIDGFCLMDDRFTKEGIEYYTQIFTNGIIWNVKESLEEIVEMLGLKKREERETDD